MLVQCLLIDQVTLANFKHYTKSNRTQICSVHFRQLQLHEHQCALQVYINFTNGVTGKHKGRFERATLVSPMQVRISGSPVTSSYYCCCSLLQQKQRLGNCSGFCNIFNDTFLFTYEPDVGMVNNYVIIRFSLMVSNINTPQKLLLHRIYKTNLSKLLLRKTSVRLMKFPKLLSNSVLFLRTKSPQLNTVSYIQ